MKFRTRVSILLLIFVSIPALIVSYTAVTTGEYGALSGIIYIVFVLPLLFCISYVIDGDTLYVRSFPFTKGATYDLKKLKSISPTRSILSAPASSLKRIKLDFGCGDALVISPAAQELFVEEIRKANPDVIINL